MHPSVTAANLESGKTSGVALAFTSLNHETELACLPVEGSIPGWLTGRLYRNGPAKFEREPERGTNFLVIDKHTGKPTAIYKGAACFAFHHINAYEQDGNIVVDIAATDEPELLRKSYLKPLRAATRSEDHPLSEYRRYCLPLATSKRGSIQHELISEHRVEMVTVNAEATSGRYYRYAYGVSHNTRWHALVGQLVKVDAEKRTAQTWFEPDTYPNEPIFVAAPGAAREDDGVILSVVLDTARGRSFLLVLDATSFRELGRAHLPHHIPLEFHGIFIKDGL